MERLARDVGADRAMMPSDALCWSVHGWLARLTRWSAVLIALLLPLPLLTGDGLGSLVIVAAVALAVAGVARTETGIDRRRVVQLAVVGAAIRGGVLLALTVLQAAGDTMALGPDGVRFLAAAVMIVDSNFVLPESPFRMLGSFDVGHMYVFAGLVAAFGRSVLTLHVFNSAVTVLLGPLTYAWVRLAAPRLALPAAVTVTVYPSIMYLATVDIWKDPMVITATTVAIWAVAHICHGGLGNRGLAAMTVVAGASLAFVHTSRFYPLWYLEVGLATTGLIALVRRAPINWRVVLALTAVVTMAEGLPGLGGWPASPRMFAGGVSQAMGATSMRYYTAGLLDRLAKGATSPTERATDYRLQNLEAYGLREFGRTTALQVDIETASADPSRFGLLGWAVQLVRRVWGPFIWIAPPSFTARGLLGGDYLMYPGMLFWYALLPFMAAGLVITGVEIVRGRAPVVLGVVWVYAVLYSGQFLVINLPYRQREAMFPVLVVFGLLASAMLWRHRWTRRVYVMYWVLLGAVAAAHLAARSGLVAAG